MTKVRTGIVVMLCALAVAGTKLRQARAADATSAQPYSGSVLSRSTLSGDWVGSRSDLASKGVTFDANVTQITQGVVDGGKDSSWEYGGRGDLTINLDTQKLGLWPGGFVTGELEGNWENAVNGSTGGINPANSNHVFPVPGGGNVAVPNLSIAQFVSHYAGMVVGKLQTVTTGDMNEFAHGKGDTRFLNLAFNINPTLLVTPYSTLGAGAIVLPTADPKEALLTAMVLSATGKASTSGFDHLNGAIFSVAGRVRTNFCDRTGHQVLGGLYSNKAYTSLDQRISVTLGRPGHGLAGSQSLATQRDTWAVYYNFDQFLYETDKEAGNGVGLFGRFGASAGNPNPSQYFFSIGFGGKGMIPGRADDRFGIGYYYDSIENPTLTVAPLGTKSFLRDEWGFEAFYNIALTRWLLLTPDVQVIGPAQKRAGALAGSGSYIDPAAVLGLRLQVVL